MFLANEALCKVAKTDCEAIFINAFLEFVNYTEEY